MGIFEIVSYLLASSPNYYNWKWISCIVLNGDWPRSDHHNLSVFCYYLYHRYSVRSHYQESLQTGDGHRRVGRPARGHGLPQPCMERAFGNYCLLCLQPSTAGSWSSCRAGQSVTDILSHLSRRGSDRSLEGLTQLRSNVSSQLPRPESRRADSRHGAFAFRHLYTLKSRTQSMAENDADLPAGTSF